MCSWGRRHSKATNSHGSPLKNGINETFYRVLKQNVSNVANLRISLCSRAWVKDKAMAAKLFHLSFEASDFNDTISMREEDWIVMCSFLNQTHRSHLLLLPWVYPQHELLHVVSLCIVEEVLHARETLSYGRSLGKTSLIMIFEIKACPTSIITWCSRKSSFFLRTMWIDKGLLVDELEGWDRFVHLYRW